MNVFYILLLNIISFITSSDVDLYDEYNSSVYAKLIKEGKFKLDERPKNFSKLFEEDEEIGKEFDKKFKKKIDRTEEKIIAPEKIRERIMNKEQAIRLEREAKEDEENNKIVNIENELTDEDKDSLITYEKYMLELNILGNTNCPRNIFRQFIEKVFESSIFSNEDEDKSIDKHLKVKFYDIFMRHTLSPIDITKVEDYFEEEKIDTIMEELSLYKEDL